MMKAAATVALIAAWAQPTSATEFGTLEDGLAMLSRAIKAVKSDKAGAISRFNYNDPEFRDRDLFVFCFNRADGRFTAHEAFVGHDVKDLRDAAGAHVGKDLYHGSQENRLYQTTFSAPRPGSTETATKVAFIIAVDDQSCGVSVYESMARSAPTR